MSFATFWIHVCFVWPIRAWLGMFVILTPPWSSIWVHLYHLTTWRPFWPDVFLCVYYCSKLFTVHSFSFERFYRVAVPVTSLCGCPVVITTLVSDIRAAAVSHCLSADTLIRGGFTDISSGNDTWPQGKQLLLVCYRWCYGWFLCAALLLLLTCFHPLPPCACCWCAAADGNRDWEPIYVADELLSCCLVVVWHLHNAI